VSALSFNKRLLAVLGSSQAQISICAGGVGEPAVGVRPNEHRQVYAIVVLPQQGVFQSPSSPQALHPPSVSPAN
jgi:hypothetical protein